ncbi:hypothetical protein [Thermorudis peleae]|uniref:hypothetical protein n=1 Tax=Thermorudis peleae TaxID=1382356 RepID=UPI00056E3A18|nr:hypothetical protein [Thermorudis peleae]MBX6753749.1 hypothetical protein [Thermorudis peleae]
MRFSFRWLVSLALAGWLGYHIVGAIRAWPLDVYECGEWRGPALALMLLVLDLPLLVAVSLLACNSRWAIAWGLTGLAILGIYVVPQLWYFRMVGLNAPQCALKMPAELQTVGVLVDVVVAALCFVMAGARWTQRRRTLALML